MRGVPQSLILGMIQHPDSKCVVRSVITRRWSRG